VGDLILEQKIAEAREAVEKRAKEKSIRKAGWKAAKKKQRRKDKLKRKQQQIARKINFGLIAPGSRP
jgi:hypothetical protein